MKDGLSSANTHIQQKINSKTNILWRITGRNMKQWSEEARRDGSRLSQNLRGVFAELIIYTSVKITWTLSSLVLHPGLLRIKTGLSRTPTLVPNSGLNRLAAIPANVHGFDGTRS